MVSFLAVILLMPYVSGADNFFQRFPEVIQQQQREEQDRAMRDAQKDQQKKANEDRQKALKNDTDQLLKLAQELKASVDKSDKNTLSLDVLKKASQIEQLAKSVQKKMRAEDYMPVTGDQPIPNP